MSESSPVRQIRGLDDSSSNSRRNSIDLRQLALLSTTTPSLASGHEWHCNPVFAPPASLLNSRRASLTSLAQSAGAESLLRRSSRTDVLEAQTSTEQTEPASPEDGSNFRRSLQIDVKGLVGDAVGNMSVSPSSRDIVLAARRGLFIIDLEAPLKIPRFLPQGGTWDVVDVQWNPHPSRAEYIVSTSSEKLLIWNLLLVGKTSIEFILQAHYRAITDINWHTTECDTVVSVGIDSWIWAWDLREPRKPTFGLSAFESGGTQVKWNRQDGNVLASSHGNEVLIWDRRKGSLPIKRMKAHGSKIYGIDWAHDRRDELVTCSLDKTIKIWDTSIEDTKPVTTIYTSYPVWRARSLPFGRGVLSIAQRSYTMLEMYGQGGQGVPVEKFEGHTDVVKEFVWRRGGEDEFQLITWSKDRTLRFWPIDAEVMQKVGHGISPYRGRGRSLESRVPTISYRNPPEGTGYLPMLSAPVGRRSILAEVRAPLPPRPAPVTPVVTGARSQGGTMSRGNPNNISVRAPMDPFTWLSNIKVGERRRSSEGGGDSGSRHREGNAGDGSFNVDGDGAIGEGETEVDQDGEKINNKRSDSRTGEEEPSQYHNQSLHDEITSVIAKLAPVKVKLEKHDLTKKRTCTLGLHGPWGGTSSVFLRVIFTFPRDYPQATYPKGIPIVEIERNPLISLKDRAFMMRRLTAIREHRRPCLESCLRFLLFRDEEEHPGHLLMDSESSSSEDEGGTRSASRRNKDATVTVLRGSKNLVEPRTSQGTFGPNGELVCFFRAPARIVRNVLRGLSDSPATPSEEAVSTPPIAPTPTEPPHPSRTFQSPSLVTDAIRRLSGSAKDRPPRPSNTSHRIGDRDRHNIERIMTNLLTLQPNPNGPSSGEKRPLGLLLKSYALLSAPPRSTVFLTSTTNIAGGDYKVAKDYVFGEGEEVGKTELSEKGSFGEWGSGLKDVCAVNARAARRHGRYDHERAFKTIQALLPVSLQTRPSFDGLAGKVITELYIDFAKNKDTQMLAMLSVLLLRIYETIAVTSSTPLSERGTTGSLSLPRSERAPDYFGLQDREWPRLPSPRSPQLSQQQQLSALLPASMSPRVAWSSLFNASSMRQFMSGVQDTLMKESLSHPDGSISTLPLNVPARPGSSVGSAESMIVGGVGSSMGAPLLVKNERWSTEGRKGRKQGDQQRQMAKEPGRQGRPSSSAGAHTPPIAAAVPRSLKSSLSTSAIEHRRIPLAQVMDPGNIRPSSTRVTTYIGDGISNRSNTRSENRVLVFEPSQLQSEAMVEQGTKEAGLGAIFNEKMLQQMKLHVHVYADHLCRWKLYQKRLEMLKVVRRTTVLPGGDGSAGHTIGIVRTCTRCGIALPSKVVHCPSCNASCSMAKCTICRLPVKGLSRSCLQCFHVTHISCWDNLGRISLCPTGCGCWCNGMEEVSTRPSSRHGFPLSPPSTAMALTSFP